MQKALIALPLLLLASCASGYVQGRREFVHGMTRLQTGSPYARGSFYDAEKSLAYALGYENLIAHEWILASSFRTRALIELGRHEEARAQTSIDIEEFDASVEYEGDPVGTNLIRAHALDPERALGRLLLAERFADTRRTRLHVAWEQAHLLAKMGTEKAKGEALKICKRNPGELDFDDLAKTIGKP